jgi:hypothetical protein
MPVTNSSGYKGVTYYKTNRNWKARIRIEGKQVSLGSFPTAELAAWAYNEAVLFYHDEKNISSP